MGYYGEVDHPAVTTAPPVTMPGRRPPTTYGFPVSQPRRPRPARLRLCTLALGLVTALVAPLAPMGAASAADPYDTTAVSALITRLEADLRAQNARVESTAAELTRGTAQWEKGKAELARTHAKAVEAQAGADQALLQVGVASQHLDEVAAAAYRNPVPSEIDLLLSSSGEDFSRTLATAGMLRLRRRPQRRRAAPDDHRAAGRRRERRLRGPAHPARGRPGEGPRGRGRAAHRDGGEGGPGHGRDGQPARRRPAGEGSPRRRPQGGRGGGPSQGRRGGCPQGRGGGGPQGCRRA